MNNRMYGEVELFVAGEVRGGNTWEDEQTNCK
jgi:hypothetical protein